MTNMHILFSQAALRPGAWRTFALALSIAALSHSAFATNRYSRSQLQGMPIPIYCADSELSDDYVRNGPRWKYWAARMGPTFNAIHHYCQGLIDVISARKALPGSPARIRLLRKAINEYDFLLRESESVLRAQPLWPEMLVRRGEAAVMLEDWGLAYSSYEDARRVKPDYAPAYEGWAEVLIKLGKRDEARALLKQGLTQAPTAESLRKLYAKLGGSPDEVPSTSPALADVPTAAASAAAVAASASAR